MIKWRDAIPQCGAVLIACLATASATDAHEFWLDPADFAPKVGTRVPIVHRNGQDFLGDSYPYVRAWSKRFAVLDAKGERPIKAVEGDDPAVELAVPNAGLTIVAFHRAPDVVTYTSLGHWLEVLDDEGLETIAAQYRALPSPPATIRESYTRFAKTLLNVGGGGAGADRAVGQALEIVVETNPYRAGAGAPLIARVLRDGKPIADVQVKAFNRADPQSPRRVRTDADGRVTITGVPAGEVLLSAVVMLPGDPNARDGKVRADWTSLWASVTFKRL